MPERAETPPGRVMVVDILRLVATFQMVQGHTIDAVLAPVFRTGAVHDLWLVGRGLTSVAFLFAAGLSFHLATVRKLERHRADHTAVRRRFVRAGILLLLGYMLRFPWAALWPGDPAAASQALADFAIVDILQCIGITLCLLEVLAVCLPSRRAIALTCGFLGAGALLLGPAAASVDPTGPWRPLLNYVSVQGGSLFPLLPWSAHMLLGVALAPLLLSGERRLRLLAGGVALLVLGWGLEAAVGGLVTVHVERLGWVVVGTAGLCLAEAAARSWPGWLLGLSRQTLFIYVVHVLLVYGEGFGFSSLLGPVLDPLRAMLLAIGMVLVMAWVTVLLQRRGRPRPA